MNEAKQFGNSVNVRRPQGLAQTKLRPSWQDAAISVEVDVTSRELPHATPARDRLSTSSLPPLVANSYQNSC
jgi:hypothetical protein